MSAALAQPPSDPVHVPDASRLRDLVAGLGAESWEAREEAQRLLVEAGAATAPFLARAMEDPDPEVRSRAQAVWAEVTRSTVTLRFVDTAGAPLAGVPAWANVVLKQRGHEPEIPATTEFTGTTDADGRLVLSVPETDPPLRFPYGEYIVRAGVTTDPERLPWTHPDYPLRGGNLEIPVPMARGGRIRSRWTEAPEGAKTRVEPVPGIRGAEHYLFGSEFDIEDWMRETPPPPGLDSPAFDTGANLRPGRYRLSLLLYQDDEWQQERPGPLRTVREGDDIDILECSADPTVEPATLQVHLPEGAFPDGETLILEGRFTGRPAREERMDAADAPGHSVAAGWWRAAYDRDGFGFFSEWIRVTPGEERECRAPARPAARDVEVRLPSPGEIVEILTDSRDRAWGLRRDETGSNEIPLLFTQEEPGRVTVSLPSGDRQWPLQLRTRDGRILIRNAGGSTGEGAAHDWIEPGTLAVLCPEADPTFLYEAHPQDARLAAFDHAWGEPNRDRRVEVRVPPGVCEATACAGSTYGRTVSAWVRSGETTEIALPPSREGGPADVRLAFHAPAGGPLPLAQVTTTWGMTAWTDGLGRFVSPAPYRLPGDAMRHRARIDHPDAATTWVTEPWPGVPVRMEPAVRVAGRLDAGGPPPSPGGVAFLFPAEDWVARDADFGPPADAAIAGPVSPDGSFGFEGVATTREYWLALEHPTLACVPRKFRADGDAPAVLDALPATLARVRLKDDAGTPAPGEVRLFAWDEAGGRRGHEFLLARERSDAEGMAFLPGVPQGRMHMVATSPGLGSRLVEVEIREGGDPIEVTIPAGGTLCGTVRGLPADGPPAFVRVTGGTLLWAEPTAEGHFLVHGVPAGETTLAVFSGDTLLATRTIAMGAGEVQRIEWDL